LNYYAQALDIKIGFYSQISESKVLTNGTTTSTYFFIGKCSKKFVKNKHNVCLENSKHKTILLDTGY